MRNILFLDDENESGRALLIPTEITIVQIQKFIINLENLIYKRKIVKPYLLDISSEEGSDYAEFCIGLRGDSDLDEDEFSIKSILAFVWDGRHLYKNYYVLWEVEDPSNITDLDNDIINQIIICIKKICKDNLINSSDWEKISEHKENIEDRWYDIDWFDDTKHYQVLDQEKNDMYEKNNNEDILFSPDDSIDELSLNVRSYNVLKRAGNQTVADLIHVSNEELEKYRGINQKSFEEITEIRDKIISNWKTAGVFEEYCK